MWDYASILVYLTYFLVPFTVAAILWKFPEKVTGYGNRKKVSKAEWDYKTMQDFVQHTGHEQHATMLDFDIFEQFEKPSGENKPLPAIDLRIRAACKAVDAGLVLPNINDGFGGNAPDLGAHEAGSEVPHYGPRK